MIITQILEQTFPGDPILHWSLPEFIHTFKLRPIYLFQNYQSNQKKMFWGLIQN